MSDERESHDAELYHAATRGEQGASDRLLASYLPRLHAFVRLRMGNELRARDASVDIVQSVCKDLVARSDFEYRDEAKFRSWLFTAALNKIRSRHRHHHRDRRDIDREVPVEAAVDRDGELLAAYAATVSTPSMGAVAREEVERIERAFEQLPDDYREVIGLARIAGLPHVEVAERMKRSVGAMRQLLGRATVRLAELLE